MRGSGVLLRGWWSCGLEQPAWTADSPSVVKVSVCVPYGPLIAKQSPPGSSRDVGRAFTVGLFGVLEIQGQSGSLSPAEMWWMLLQSCAARSNNGPKVHTATQMDLHHPVLHEKIF